MRASAAAAMKAEGEQAAAMRAKAKKAKKAKKPLAKEMAPAAMSRLSPVEQALVIAAQQVGGAMPAGVCPVQIAVFNYQQHYQQTARANTGCIAGKLCTAAARSPGFAC